LSLSNEQYSSKSKKTDAASYERSTKAKLQFNSFFIIYNYNYNYNYQYNYNYKYNYNYTFKEKVCIKNDLGFLLYYTILYYY
jgi:hypothetical protein